MRTIYVTLSESFRKNKRWHYIIVNGPQCRQSLLGILFVWGKIQFPPEHIHDSDIFAIPHHLSFFLPYFFLRICRYHLFFWYDKSSRIKSFGKFVETPFAVNLTLLWYFAVYRLEKNTTASVVVFDRIHISSRIPIHTDEWNETVLFDRDLLKIYFLW